MSKNQYPRTNQRHESNTTHVNHERRSEDKNRLSIAKKVGIAALAVLVAKEGIDAFQDNNYQQDYGGNKISAESISIQDHAKIRKEPVVSGFDFSNTLTTLDFGDLSGSDAELRFTPGSDVYRVTSQGDGDWYGVSIDDLSEAIPSIADDLSKDSDGIAWINRQRASVEETSPSSEATDDDAPVILK